MNLLSAFVVISLAAYGQCQVVDQTRIPGAKGSAVVEAVINFLHETCVFPNDRLYLRRLAFVESRDGLDANAYRDGYYGGIWQINRNMYDQTKASGVLQTARDQLKSTLGIDWSKTNWEDLRRPLYSGVAAALYTLLKAGSSGVPATIEKQASFWTSSTTHSTGEAHDFYSKVNTLVGSCSSANQIDILFILDSSTSLDANDFDISKDFVSSVVNNFDVAANRVQVAVIEYSTAVDVSFYLNTYHDKSAVTKAVEGIRYTSGGTNTALALQYAVDDVFSESRGMRKESSKVLILITDGKSDNTRLTTQQAAAAKNKGINVFTIGVTNLVDKNELDAIASSPTCTHSQVLNSFTDLDSLKSEIQRVSCKAPVVLTSTNYSFPCGNDVNVKIIPAVGAGSTITITPIDGFVSIYGSVVSGVPSSVNYEFTKIADASVPVTFFVRGNHPVNLALVSSVQNSCRSTFFVDVEAGNTIKHNSNLLCINQDLTVKLCSANTLQQSPFLIVPPPYKIQNPCIGAVASFLEYPYSNDRFIYCDGRGNYFIVLCTVNNIFNLANQVCIPGTVMTFTMTPPQTTMTPTRTTPTPPRTQTPQPTGTLTTNPCTPTALLNGQFFFPYPGDKRAFIQCYNLPYVAVVKFCDEYHYWDQKTLTCLYDELVIVHPTKNTFDLNKNNPCGTIKDLYFYPFPGNDRMYIQCDDFDDAFEMTCPDHKYWNNANLQCIPRDIVYFTSPPDVQVSGRPGVIVPIGKK